MAAKVLLVEDDRALREALADTLCLGGHDYRAVDCAEAEPKSQVWEILPTRSMVMVSFGWAFPATAAGVKAARPITSAAVAAQAAVLTLQCIPNPQAPLPPYGESKTRPPGVLVGVMAVKNVLSDPKLG